MDVFNIHSLFMRFLLSISFCCIFLLSTAQNSNNCSDSAVVMADSLVGDSLVFFNTNIFENGATIQSTPQNAGNYSNKVYLTLTDSQYKKTIIAQLQIDNNTKFQLQSTCSLSNNDIAVQGNIMQLIPTQGEFLYTIVGVFDRNLNLKWFKKIYVQDSSRTEEMYMRNFGLCTDNDGNIYSCSQNNLGLYGALCLVSLTKQGSFRWSSTIYLDDFIDGNTALLSCVGNKIIIAAASTKNGTGNNSIIKTGFNLFSFNKNSGNYISNKNYYSNYLTSNLNLILGSQSGSQFRKEMQVLNNGNFAVAFYEIQKDANGQNRKSCWLIAEVDSNLSVKKTKRIQLNNAFNITVKPFCGISKNGTIAFNSTSISNNKIAVIDSVGKTIFNGSVNVNYAPKSFINGLFYNDYTSTIKITGVDTSSISPKQLYYEFPIKASQNYLLDGCIANVDSAIFNVQTWDLSPVNTIPLILVDYSAVTIADINLTQQLETKTKTILCQKVSNCNEIKIIVDSVLCLQKPFVVKANKNADCMQKIHFEYDTLYFNKLNITDTSMVLEPKKVGQTLIKTYLNNCVASDSMYISIVSPLQSFSLGKDTVLCEKKTINLNAPTGAKKYYWSTGETSQNIFVNKEGNYTVKVEDYCGNVFSDTLKVEYSNISLSTFSTTTICIGDTLKITKQPNFISYNWIPNTNILNEGDSIYSFYPKLATTYLLKAFSNDKCFFERNVLINIDECLPLIWFPTAFTPNNDGLNDIFKAISKGKLVDFNLTLYNRWGQKIFTSNSIKDGWNGTFNGNFADAGIYVWYCRYQFKNEVLKTQKGIVSLLR